MRKQIADRIKMPFLLNCLSFAIVGKVNVFCMFKFLKVGCSYLSYNELIDSSARFSVQIGA